MYYVLKLYSNSWLIEGVYSTRELAEQKARHYISRHGERIKFYDIECVSLNSKLDNEEIIEGLYC